MTLERPTRVERFVRRADVAFTALLVAGALAAVGGWRPAVALLLVGFAGNVGGHLAVGVAAYRRVMKRPWPQMRAAVVVVDDDW